MQVDVSSENEQRRLRPFLFAVLGDCAVVFDPRVLRVAKHSEVAIFASEEKDVTGAGFFFFSMDDVLGLHVLRDELDEFPLAKVDNFAWLVNAQVNNHKLLVGRLVVL